MEKWPDCDPDGGAPGVPSSVTTRHLRKVSTMDATDTLPSPSLARVQQRFREVLTALPRLLADKLLLGSSSADEEIDLGRLRVITGSKYHQYCRAKYGATYLETFAEKYLTETGTTDPTTAGPEAVRSYRSLLGKVGHIFSPSYDLTPNPPSDWDTMAIKKQRRRQNRKALRLLRFHPLHPYYSRSWFGGLEGMVPG